MVKKYIPNKSEKYMCAKQKTFFKKKLLDWKKEIIEINSKSLYLNDIDHEISSPDVVKQFKELKITPMVIVKKQASQLV